MTHHAARRRPIPGVEGRLPATDLRLGKLDRAAEMFQDFDGRTGGIVVKRIAKARGHQMHPFAGRTLAFRVGHGE